MERNGESNKDITDENYREIDRDSDSEGEARNDLISLTCNQYEPLLLLLHTVNTRNVEVGKVQKSGTGD